MAAIDKLLKFLNTKNIATLLDDDKQKKIADDVILGYEIDEDSRKGWLETNKQAMKIIKHAETSATDPDKDFPFYKASKVVYPLLQPAVIQLASRLSQHTVRNGKVADFTVLGHDQPQTDPQTGKPSGVGIKEAKADRITSFFSNELLVESDTWLMDEHKMCSIVASWGMAFKKLYVDPVTNEKCIEVIAPEDIIINQKSQSLSKARRITIRLYMTNNELVEKERAGEFINVDDLPLTLQVDNAHQENDSRELQQVNEVLEQTCYLDLDDDGYEEPYCVFVHHNARRLLGIYPAFEHDDIKMNPKGKILKIIPRINIVDLGLIDDPEGNYYKLGLNHLLIHTNKAITAVLRQLIDAGILANTAASSGFVTKAFKTKERAIRTKLGQYQVLDVPPGTDIKSQIMNMPFNEPSQVLLALLEFLVNSGKEMGFMTDVLTGDAQTQNVPATTMLAMVEQGTRAFKPMVQKYFQSKKNEFKILFHLYCKNPDMDKYVKFQDLDPQLLQHDFDEDSFDVMPAADPTMSSEAHKYSRLQAAMQFYQTTQGQGINLQELATRFFTDLEYPSPEMLVSQPQPPQPDPTKVMEMQLKEKIAADQHTINQLKQQNEQLKLGLEDKKVELKQQEINIKSGESKARTQKTVVDAHKEMLDSVNQAKMTDIEQQNADTEARRVEVLAHQPRNKNSP